MILFIREENAVATNLERMYFKLLARFIPLKDSVITLTKPKTQVVKISSQTNQSIELETSNQEHKYLADVLRNAH